MTCMTYRKNPSFPGLNRYDLGMTLYDLAMTYSPSFGART
jgi:hypothetical protein